MTHIGLNLVYLVPGETGGMESHALDLIPALVEQAPDVRFTAFVNREAAERGAGAWQELVRTVPVPVRARNRLEWVRGEQQLLPRLAASEGVDLVHSLASTGPAWGRFRRVVTIHDLIYRIHPEAHLGLRAHGMRVLVTLAARRSDRIIAISRSTERDILRYLRVPPEKVDYVRSAFRSRTSAVAIEEAELRERFDLGARRIVLSVSAKRPHKNVAGLLEALALIPPERRPVCAIPGYPTPYEDELRRRAAELGVAGDVRLLDWVSDEELEGLYRAAHCFVFPSFYEGFGLPVLEAMARGLPVACSDRSSLPEVVGHAALLFNPGDPREITAAIERLLNEPRTASRLRAAGYARAAMFDWASTAQGTLESYGRALGRPLPD